MTRNSRATQEASLKETRPSIWHIIAQALEAIAQVWPQSFLHAIGGSAFIFLVTAMEIHGCENPCRWVQLTVLLYLWGSESLLCLCLAEWAMYWKVSQQMLFFSHSQWACFLSIFANGACILLPILFRALKNHIQTWCILFINSEFMRVWIISLRKYIYVIGCMWIPFYTK